MASGLTLRVAVVAWNGSYSAAFRFWTPRGKGDLYAGVRSVAGDFKVSLHEAGRCHAGLTQQFASNEPGLVNALGQTRHGSEWTRQTNSTEFVSPLEIVIPTDELRADWGHEPSREVQCLPAPPEGWCTHLMCHFARAPVAKTLPSPAPMSVGLTVLAEHTLPNGEMLLIAADTRPASQTVEQLVRYAHEHTNSGGWVKAESNPGCGPRSLAVFDEDPHRLLVVDTAAPAITPVSA